MKEAGISTFHAGNFSLFSVNASAAKQSGLRMRLASDGQIASSKTPRNDGFGPGRKVGILKTNGIRE